MSWLESHQELRDHPKTARLRRRLGVSLPAAVGHLHLLWWWALDYAPTGHLAPYDADVIADAACWEDDPGVFVRALIGAGFLNDDMTIHDWEDYAGRLLDRREANAKRMREARKARRAELLAEPVSGARVSDGTAQVSGTFAGRGGLPDLTGPNHTGPDRTGPHPPNLLPREGGTFPADVVQRLSMLPDDLDAPTFHAAAESALTSLGFSCEREVWVGDRGDGRRGRLDLVAERRGVTIALELDDRSPRRNSLDKLRRSGCTHRAAVLRCPADGPLPDVGGDVVVIGAGRARAPAAPPDDLVPATDDDLRIWHMARERLTEGWLPANAAKAEAFEPLGRDPSGWLWIRAPAGARSVASQPQIATALVGAGDPFGSGVRIVEG